MATATKSAETTPKATTKGKEKPKPVTPAQLATLSRKLARQAAMKAKAKVDQFRDADGNIDRNATDDYQSAVVGDSVTLISPELGREGIQLPGCTGSQPDEVGEGIGKLAERFDQKIAITGRSDSLDVTRAKRDHFLRRFTERLTAAGRDGFGVALIDGYQTSLLTAFIEKNPDATEDDCVDYLESLEHIVE